MLHARNVLLQRNFCRAKSRVNFYGLTVKMRKYFSFYSDINDTEKYLKNEKEIDIHII